MSGNFFESFNALAFSHAAGTPLQLIEDNHAKSVHDVLMVFTINWSIPKINSFER
jgi:hypothetical protein